jgi:hypothetical protein
MMPLALLHSLATETAAPEVEGSLPYPQLVLALVLALSMFAIVVELVRRQKLREEYAILWMSTAALLMLFALYVDIPAWIANLVGAESVSSVLFFGAHVFLMLVALQFSVRLTKLTFRNKTLSQQVALLEQRITELAERLDAAGQDAHAPDAHVPDAHTPDVDDHARDRGDTPDHRREPTVIPTPDPAATADSPRQADRTPTGQGR